MQLLAAGGAPDSVVANFDTAFRQDVLEETFDKLERRKGNVANLLGSIVAVAKTDLPVVEGFQTAVGDGEAEDVAAQILRTFSRPIFSSRGMGANRRAIPSG